jgi:hypothetical protein
VIASNCIIWMGLLSTGIGGGGVDGTACGSGDTQQAKDKGELAHPAIGDMAKEETNNCNGLRTVVMSGEKLMIEDGECGSKNDVRSIILLTPE